jgi:dolichol-phosphate mannosyltransferase
MFQIHSQPAYDPSWNVPDAVYWVSFQRSTKYCVVIPVINEGTRIIKQLRKMCDLKIMSLTDVIVTDGGSIDNSLDHQFLASMNIRALLIKQDTGKLSTQLRIAYAFALLEGYEGIITIDGNNKDSVESIPFFIDALDHGFDYIQGSRYMKGGRAVNTPLIRYFGLRFVHAPLVSIAARYWFTDTTNGFRAYSTRYLLFPDVQPFRDIFQTYELLYYLSSRASRLGLKVKEVPVVRAYPPRGPIPTKISPVYGSFLMLKVLIFVLLGKYNPKRNKRRQICAEN